MKVTESRVPGYEARVIELDPADQFVLRNPEDRTDALVVRQVVAFDTGPDGDQPYYRVVGFPLGGGAEREMSADLTDVGKLPPHVRNAVGGCPQDHSPADRNPYQPAIRARQNMLATISRAKTGERRPLSADELAHLRQRYGVTGEHAKPGRRSQAELDAEQARVVQLNARLQGSTRERSRGIR